MHAYALVVAAALSLALARSPPSRLRGVSAEYPRWLDDVSADLGIPPPRVAPKWVWQLAWRGHKRALPLLHARDP